MQGNWEKMSAFPKTTYRAENECGTFCCDKNALLTYFEPAKQNRLSQPPFGYRNFNVEKAMKKLIFPEGIRIIGNDEEDLGRLIIVEKLILPATLEKLGEHVLADCLIMDLHLPLSLKEIGPAALMASYIHVLRIPQGMLPPRNLYGWDPEPPAGPTLTIHGRQFKETIVDTLIVPKNYPYSGLFREAQINHVVFTEEA